MMTARYNVGAVFYPIHRENNTEALLAQSTRRNIHDNLSYRFWVHAYIRYLCLF